MTSLGCSPRMSDEALLLELSQTGTESAVMRTVNGTLQRLQGQLRMSKREILEEYKETEGNPAIKARVRRLQRQVRRRRMMKDAERASVVVTNPTHYAVALEYRADMAGEPVVGVDEVVVTGVA